MTKKEILNSITVKTALSKTTCERVIDALAEVVEDCLVAGDKFTIKNFLSLEAVERSARKGRNPSTGEIVEFPATKTVKCKVCKAMKDAINGRVTE